MKVKVKKTFSGVPVLKHTVTISYSLINEKHN